MIDKYDGWDYSKQAYRRVCRYCGLVVYTDEPQVGFCSSECYNLYFSGARIAVCENCGLKFDAYKRQNVYCSNACRQQAYRKRQKRTSKGEWRKRASSTKRKQKISKVCEHCGSDFVVTGLEKKRQYCSDACKQAQYRKLKNN